MDRPVPPPPRSSTQAVEPRRPGLRATSPARLEQSLAARDVLRGLVARRHISVRELAECWGVSARVAQQKLTGEAPLHVGEAFALPHRIALELVGDARSVVLMRRAG